MDGPPIAEYDSPPGRRRRRGPADASMSLLNDLMTHTVDEDYSFVAHRRPPVSRRSHLATALVAAVFGLILAVAAVQTDLSRPALEEERAGLIERIHAQGDNFDELERRSGVLAADVRGLQADVDRLTTQGEQVGQRAERLGVVTGSVPVGGPGLVVTVDDAGPAAGHQGQVLDGDLRTLVNGLWVAGAEAVSVNGQRVTSRTAIGSANRAITVNFRSLRAPYVVCAIGDPDTIEARFFETAAGQAWLDLEANFGLGFETETDPSLTIPARGVGQLRYAAGGPEVPQ